MLLEGKEYELVERILCVFRYVTIFFALFSLDTFMYFNTKMFSSLTILIVVMILWVWGIYFFSIKMGTTPTRRYWLSLAEWVGDFVCINAFCKVFGIYGNSFIYVFLLLLIIIAFIRYGNSMTTYLLVGVVFLDAFFIHKVLYSHHFISKNQDFDLAMVIFVLVAGIMFLINQEYERLKMLIDVKNASMQGLEKDLKRLHSMNEMSTNIYRGTTVEHIIEALLKNMFRLVEEPGIRIFLYGENNIESDAKMYDYKEVRGSSLREDDELPYRMVYAQKDLETIRNHKDYKNCLLDHEPIVLNNLWESFKQNVLWDAEEKYVYIFNLVEAGRENGLIICNISKRLEPFICNQIEELVQHVGLAVHTAKRLEDERSKVIYDQITHAKTRRYMDEMMPLYRKWALKQGAQIAVIFLDIDYFKRFNDSYGHATGDQVLKLVVQVAESTFPSDSLVVRYGGEEFVGVLKTQDQEAVAEIAETLRRRIQSADLKDITGDDSHITVSMGIAFYPSDSGDINEVIKHADEAMYKVKQTTRNNVCLYHTINREE